MMQDVDLPPHDEFQERGVLGALLAQPDRKHAEALLDDLAPFLDACGLLPGGEPGGVRGHPPAAGGPARGRRADR